MKRILHALKMTEISGVDRPANEHARAVIMKRHFSKSEEYEMSREELVKSLSRDFGAMMLAKHIVEDGNGPSGVALTEADFTEIMVEYAKSQLRGDETPEQAFARLFSDPSSDGGMLRKAHAIVKGIAITAPRQVGGRAATAIDNPTGALAQLQKLAEEQRKRSPALTLDQAFAQVYADPANRDLVVKERGENRPRAERFS